MKEVELLVNTQALKTVETKYCVQIRLSTSFALIETVNTIQHIPALYKQTMFLKL